MASDVRFKNFLPDDVETVVGGLEAKATYPILPSITISYHDCSLSVVV